MEMNGTTITRRPVETVFDYVIDLAYDANWRTGLDESGLREGESLGAGAVGYSLSTELAGLENHEQGRRLLFPLGRQRLDKFGAEIDPFAKFGVGFDAFGSHVDIAFH